MTAAVAALATFLLALDARPDSARALPLFREAAAGFDAAWQDESIRNAGLAANRARAHFFAKNLPAAVAALRAGLHESPTDRTLQRDLEFLRDRIDYPDPSWRPGKNDGWRHRIARRDLFAFAALGAVFLAYGLARRRRIILTIGILIFAMATTLAIYGVPPAFAVVRLPVPLRLGSGTAYPAVLPAPLPAGQELNVLFRRGDWLRVQVPNGTTGWLPADAAI
jgi:hypothetical protein